jgi:hypothetical protein
MGGQAHVVMVGGGSDGDARRLDAVRRRVADLGAAVSLEIARRWQKPADGRRAWAPG